MIPEQSATLVAAATTQRVCATVAAHARGECVSPVYVAVHEPDRATAVLDVVSTELRHAGQGERALICGGADFTCLWRDTLRRGMTPFVRRALAARSAILVADIEALREDPFAQAELARLVAPGRLVILAGHGHLHHLAAWSPILGACLERATSFCLHDGPCVTDADAWAIIDRVAGYYAVSRATLLSRRRTATIALARQVAMYLLRQEGLTYERVGHLLRRDHSTVQHGSVRIARIGARAPHIRHDLTMLRQRADTA